MVFLILKCSKTEIYLHDMTEEAKGIDDEEIFLQKKGVNNL